MQEHFSIRMESNLSPFIMIANMKPFKKKDRIELPHQNQYMISGYIIEKLLKTLTMGTRLARNETIRF